MDLDKVFSCFISHLNDREGHLTEDSVRYFWFASMLEQDKNLNDYVLELPYGKMGSDADPFTSILANPSWDLGKFELDFMYKDDSAKEIICMEIKFHRNGDSNSTYAHPDEAGKIINDMRRLQAINPSEGCRLRRLFLYVTDDEMADYFNRGTSAYRKKINVLFNSSVGSPFYIDSQTNIPDAPKTFQRSASLSFSPKNNDGYSDFALDVKTICKAEISNGSCSVLKGDKMHVRLYEIM